MRADAQAASTQSAPRAVKWRRAGLLLRRLDSGSPLRFGWNDEHHPARGS